MGEEEDMPPRMFKGKPPKCHNCGVIGHTEKKCWGHRTVYMGDLPPSVTEEWVRELVGDIGVYSYMKVGVNVKDGGKYAFLGMESREAGDAVIEALHLQEVKGREITVKWKEEGMWTCKDPSCGKSNFDIQVECVRCKLKRHK